MCGGEAEPDKMGRSQAAYDSPRQKLARSPRGRFSDAAKHDTVVFFPFLPFFLELAAAALFLVDMKRGRSSEMLRPAALSASTILYFFHPVPVLCFFQSCLPPSITLLL